MGVCVIQIRWEDHRGIKQDKYISRVQRGGSRGRLALAFRIQRLLDSFEASETVAAVNSRPPVEFYKPGCGSKIGPRRVSAKPTSRDEIPSATNFLPHVEENPILLLGPRGFRDTGVEFLAKTFSSLIIRPAWEIFGNFVPTVAVLADSLQEQLVFLDSPPPLSERGIKRVDPALATGLV